MDHGRHPDCRLCLPGRGGGGYHKLPHQGGEGGGGEDREGGGGNEGKEEPDQDGGADGGGEVPEDEGTEQPGEPGLQSKEEEEVGGGGDGARHLRAEEHPVAGCPEGHGEGGGVIQEKNPGAGFRSENLKRSRAL